MTRVAFCAILCLFASGCVTNTNTLATQNAQLVPINGAGTGNAPRAPARPAAPTMTPTARLASADLITINKATTSGATLTLATPQALARDCSTLGTVTVKVVEAPDHGTIIVAPGTAFSNYVPGDAPYLCNARRTPATLLTYQPTPGFSGDDIAVVQIFFPDGKAPTDRFNIAVR